MPYLAILNTENHEYVCISDDMEKAQNGIFEGFNTNVKKILETEHKNPLQEVTSEWLDSRLNKYYRHFLDGPVAIKTLQEKFEFHLEEVEFDQCYKDGKWTPRNEQDY